MKFLSRVALLLISTLAAASCAGSRSPGVIECDHGEDCDSLTGEGSGAGNNGGAANGGSTGSSGASGASSGSAGAAGRGGSAGAGSGGSAGGISGAGGMAAGASGEGCSADGMSYQSGDTFSTDCNQCLCANGSLFCTEIECAPNADCEPSECSVGNACYSNGGTNILAADGCNLCSCHDGALYCKDDEECGGTSCPYASCEHFSTCFADGDTDIPAGDGCNTCTCTSGDLECTEEICERFDEPPCESDACQINGVCYPLDETSEDGCCTCEADGVSCIEESWCDGQDPIGTRCGVAGDCAPGLECKRDLYGERGMCLRDCGFGCPTGTLCADNIPGFGGGVIDNICLRPCMVSADCEPFGSECDMPPGASRRYCF